MEEKVRKVLSSLESGCARREYCSSDIMAKALKALDGDRAAAEEIVASLCRDGYIDDRRYASAFARDKAALGAWGPVKIRFQLRAKGVSDDVINEALESVETDRAADRMERLMLAKWKTLQSDPQAKLKLLKYTLGRGYEYEEVRKSIERICGNG